MNPNMTDFITECMEAFADGAIVGYSSIDNIESNPYDGFLSHSWERGFKHGMEKYFLWCHSDVKPIMETLK
jgi:hypothetical protein